jgi:hypothetical protein
MRFFCLAALLASACAFSPQPTAFTTNSPLVGERAVENVVAQSSSHRNRRATIVMDGKANGELPFLRFVKYCHIWEEIVVSFLPLEN